MSINLSNLIGSGSSSGGSTIFDFHALQRTSDGMLVYTLEDASSSISINVNLQPEQKIFASLDEPYVEAIPTSRPRNNLAGLGDLNNINDKYQQYRFENKKVRYFVDDSGYLVARLNNNYTYSGPN